ncbi:MAG: BLUF domain-containing protein [Litorimonas sp.]
MFQLIYTSVPTDTLTPKLSRDIAAQSRVTNRARGVSGVLLFSSSIILQVLEGDEATVRALYHRIRKSRSHTNCDVLLARHCESRSFAQWGMGYCSIFNDYDVKMIISALETHRLARQQAMKIAG